MSHSVGTSSSRSFVALTCSLRTGLSVRFSIGDYIKHLRLFYAHRPDFKVTCGINGCLRSYSNLGSLKNHISLMHNTESECRDHERESCADRVTELVTDDPVPEFSSGDECLTSDEDEEENLNSSHDTFSRL